MTFANYVNDINIYNAYSFSHFIGADPTKGRLINIATNFDFTQLTLKMFCNRSVPSTSYYAQIATFTAVIDGINVNFDGLWNIGGNISGLKEELIITNGKYKITILVDWGGIAFGFTGSMPIVKSCVNITIPYDNYVAKINTNLKYAEIGDSITYLADNKYETSYDDTGTANTGYKGWGYGRYLCNAIGISYANHYPQGANGRTFS